MTHKTLDFNSKKIKTTNPGGCGYHSSIPTHKSLTMMTMITSSKNKIYTN